MRRYVYYGPIDCLNLRSLLSFALILLLTPGNLLRGQGATPQGLNIEIIEGEGAINNVRLRTAREAIVEVQDENHKPVSGALVIFSVKGGNPFSRTVLQATTDFTGRVRANPLQLNGNTGKLNIQVKVSYQGRTATQVIHQTNSLEGGPSSAESAASGASGVTAVAAGAGMSALGVAIIAGAVGGGVVGGLAGAGVIGGGGGRSAQISIGTPSIH